MRVSETFDSRRRTLARALTTLLLGWAAGSLHAVAAPNGASAASDPGVAAAPESLRTLKSHCPFTPPADPAAWNRRAAELREQVLVTLGLWPLPNLDPVAARVYGRTEHDGYAVEKVIFESLPGLFVTGNLYRPHPLPPGGRRPAVLCPHGHWENARFQDVSPEGVERQLASGAELFASAARNPWQAGCVQLARMGCVVFHWDMLGYCDSTQIAYERAHRFAKQDRAVEVTDAGWLLFSPQAESQLQSVMGLQTLAVLRSIDFVSTLADVDPERIGITGASGGGTQSFIAAAIDPRISVCFPAVMVSTVMQGGCVCENACGLRIGTGNVELAALVAPRPLGLTSADDWTKTLAEDGFPELQRVFTLRGAGSNVALFPALQFGHGFHAGARTAMYGWMNRHLGLGLREPIAERDFVWLGRDALSVWDAEHPRPEGGEEFERRLLKTFQGLVESRLTHSLSEPGHAGYLETMRTGWKVVLGLTTGQIEPAVAKPAGDDAWQLASPSDGTWLVRRVGAIAAPRSSVTILTGAANDHERRRYVVALAGEGWDPAGDVASVTEQPLVDTRRLAAAYTYGYNRPLAMRRARQLAATVVWLHEKLGADAITIQGAGPGAGLAASAAFCLAMVAPGWSKGLRLEIEPDGFRFAKAGSIRDPWFLPGAGRFLDVPGLVSCLPLTIRILGADTREFARFRDVIVAQGGSLEMGD